MKEYISYKKYKEMVNKVAYWIKYEQDDEIGAIYGLPRGGLPIAVELSHKLNLPLLMNYYDRKVVTDKKILVVDDIADTGHTLKDFKNPHNIICTLHYHEDSVVLPDYYVDLKGDDWIVYPWELEDSEEVQDYFTGPDGHYQKENKYIYESPDGGNTVFRRPINNYNPKDKVEIVNGKPTGRTFEQYNTIRWDIDPNQLNLFV